MWTSDRKLRRRLLKYMQNNNKKWQDWLDRMDDYEDPTKNTINRLNFQQKILKICGLLLIAGIAYLITR